jgi:hypothetical protein
MKIEDAGYFMVYNLLKGQVMTGGAGYQKL